MCHVKLNATKAISFLVDPQRSIIAVGTEYGHLWYQHANVRGCIYFNLVMEDTCIYSKKKINVLFCWVFLVCLFCFCFLLLPAGMKIASIAEKKIITPLRGLCKFFCNLIFLPGQVKSNDRRRFMSCHACMNYNCFRKKMRILFSGY